MNKIYKSILFLSCLVWGIAPTKAQTTSGSSITLKIDGTTYTYDAQSQTSNPDFNGAQLGTFGNLQSLVVVGGQVTYARGNYPTWPTSGKMQCNVFDSNNQAVAATIDLPLTGQGIPANNWTTNNGNTNVLSGRNNGTYHLSCRFELVLDTTTIYSPANGSPFTASFTVDNKLAVSDVQKSTQNLVIGNDLYTQQKGNLTIQVYDYSGRALKTIDVMAEGSPINLGIKQKGQYILVISDSTGKKSSVKFAIQ